MTDKLPRRDGTWHYAILLQGEWWCGSVEIRRDDKIIVERFETDGHEEEVQDRLDELDAVAEYWMGRGV